MNRFFYYDGAILADLTSSLNTINLTADVVLDVNKYLYILTDYPFNGINFLIDSVTPHTNALKVEQYGSRAWRAVDDILDDTNGLQTNGRLNLILNSDYKIDLMDTEDIDELKTKKIQNKYCYRISSTGEIEVSLKFIGQIFATEIDLYSLYPELSSARTMDNFKRGKTDWIEQMEVVSRQIVKDLRARNIVFDANNILEIDKLSIPCAHKVAHIVFSAFGEDYTEQRNAAYSSYKEAIDNFRPVVDENEDGIVTRQERKVTSGVMFR